VTHRSAGLVLSALAIGGMLWRVTMAGSERDRRLLAQWASSCAQRVLPMFEVQNPTDAGPRQALETARAWVRGEVSLDQAREAAFAAHGAARAAADPAARAAARSAGRAVATAHMASHARHAADYALTAVRLAPSGDNEAVARERTWQTEAIPDAVRQLATGA